MPRLALSHIGQISYHSLGLPGRCAPHLAHALLGAPAQLFSFSSPHFSHFQRSSSSDFGWTMSGATLGYMRLHFGHMTWESQREFSNSHPHLQVTIHFLPCILSIIIRKNGGKSSRRFLCFLLEVTLQQTLSSSQASYHSLPRKHESSFMPLLVLSESKPLTLGFDSAGAYLKYLSSKPLKALP